MATHKGTKVNDKGGAAQKLAAKADDNVVQFRIADDFTSQEVARALASTNAAITNIQAGWPGLVQLPEAARSGNVGKMVTIIGPKLQLLFAALTPVAGEDPKQAQVKTRLRAIFDASLGAADHGADAAVFEVDLLQRRLERVEAEQKIVASLEALAKTFADDVINTGELVVEPGLKALDLARAQAEANADFRSILAPVLNALGEMTKPARARQAKARKDAAAVGPATAAGGAGK